MVLGDGDVGVHDALCSAVCLEFPLLEVKLGGSPPPTSERPALPTLIWVGPRLLPIMASYLLAS